MIKTRNKILLGTNTLNMFWMGDGEVPKLVKMAIKSWQLCNHHVNVWTLGKEYDFGTPVDIIDFYSIFGDKSKIPLILTMLQRPPMSDENTEERTPLAFIDWARFWMMKEFPNMKIMDADVILLKNWRTSRDKPTVVCEASNHAGNELYGYYPVAGIIHDTGEIGKFVEPRVKEVTYDGMKHGTVMKLIYDYCNTFHKLDFNVKRDKMIGVEHDYITSIDIVEHNQFFELGYDELELFYEPLSFKTIKRLKDVTGIHCWNSLLDKEKAFKEGTLLDIMYKLIMKHETRPVYDLLRIKGMKL